MLQWETESVLYQNGVLCIAVFIPHWCGPPPQPIQAQIPQHQLHPQGLIELIELIELMELIELIQLIQLIELVELIELIEFNVNCDIQFN